MTLIKSISGIRGTIGGQTGDTLNPLDIVKFVTAYATFIGKAINPTATLSLLEGMQESQEKWLETLSVELSWAWATTYWTSAWLLHRQRSWL